MMVMMPLGKTKKKERKKERNKDNKTTWSGSFEIVMDVPIFPIATCSRRRHHELVNLFHFVTTNSSKPDIVIPGRTVSPFKNRPDGVFLSPCCKQKPRRLDIFDKINGDL